jgi:hypothetical protein
MVEESERGKWEKGCEKLKREHKDCGGEFKKVIL